MDSSSGVCRAKWVQRVNISIFFERANFSGPSKDQKMTKNPTHWHQSHQLSPFKSIASRQVAFTHDFAEILRRLFLLWRHNFVTWPDPTKFFSPKVRQRMSHKLWKISARSSKRCGVQLRKTHGGVGGCINPPPARARVKVCYDYISHTKKRTRSRSRHKRSLYVKIVI